jgi:pimeloyl-ACP methyl ester carboxylesterase
MKLTISFVTLLLFLPLTTNAHLVRCTSPDGKSSTLQQGKCASATDVQTPVVAAHAQITPLSQATTIAQTPVVGSNTQTSSLARARNAFRTQLSFSGMEPGAPMPPASMFRKINYPSAVGPLAAYLSLDPQDGSRHPAIIWLTGGDCNSIGDVWSPNPRNNDQSAAAYRNAGIVMMFPSLRGGNNNPGRHEGFYGEVADVLDAYDYLSRLPYVDPTRIYLGGHSTGGTLALLTAELRNPFRAVFSFGPVGDVSGYGTDLLPLNFNQADQRERTLRSPGYWLASAQGVVFVIEGTGTPSNISALSAMQRVSQNAALHFISVAGANHFSVLAPSNEVIARKILNDLPSHKQFEMSESELQTRPHS